MLFCISSPLIRAPSLGAQTVILASKRLWICHCQCQAQGYGEEPISLNTYNQVPTKFHNQRSLLIPSFGPLSICSSTSYACCLYGKNCCVGSSNSCYNFSSNLFFALSLGSSHSQNDTLNVFSHTEQCYYKKKHISSTFEPLKCKLL